MTTYAIGTASVANGETTVTFAGASLGTASEPTLRGGDLFAVPGQPMVPPQRLISVDYGAETAELWAPWPGTTIAAAPYEVRFVDDGVRKTAQTRRYLELLGQLSALGLQPNAFGALADRAAYDDEAAGFIFLEIGDPWTLYIKLSATSADWDTGQTMEGAPGDPGTRGWSPVYAIAVDGARRVKQLVGYVGGTGDVPTANIGEYVGPVGYVSDIAEATDVRGSQGDQGPANSLTIGTVEAGLVASAELTGAAPEQVLNLVLPQGEPGTDGLDGDDGWSPVLAVVNDGDRRVHQVVDWQGGEGTKPTTGLYVGASGLTATIGDAVDIRGLPGANGSGTVASIVGGTGIDVDVTDPNNPTVALDSSTLTSLGKADTAVQPGSLGDAAGKNTGTTAGTVAAGDDSRITGAIQSSLLTTRGDLIYRNATVPARLAKGTQYQVLQAGADDPVYGAVNLAQAAAVTGVLPAANLPDASTTAEGIVELATAAEYRAGSDTTRALNSAEAWDAADLAVLTDGATIAVDFAAGFNFGGASNAPLALGGNRALGAPSSVNKNQSGVLWFAATGSTRTLTLNAAWELATGVAAGPYSITTTEELGIAYLVRGSDITVTAILRKAV